MAVKTANVMARVEPKIKEQAENILSSLGVTASSVINMLYRQIIMTRGVPFALTLPRHEMPVRDAMTDNEFARMIQQGLAEAKAGLSEDVDVVFERLKDEIHA